MSRHILVFGLLVIVATVGFAGQNLVPNPAFDDGLDGYVVPFGEPWTVDLLNGNPTGSGEPSVTCTATEPAFCTIRTGCIDISANSPPMVMNWGFAHQTLNTGGTGSIGLSVLKLTDCDAGSAIVRMTTLPAVNFDGNWADIDTSVMTETAPLDGALILSAAFSNPFGGGDTLTVNIDDFYLIGTSALIYVWDFDDGTVGEFTVSP